MKHLAWIASYPKSGNTWMRLALASLRQGGHKIDINAFSSAASAAYDRRSFDNLLDVTSSELNEAELLNLRPEFFRRLNASLRETALLKVHEACVTTPSGEPLFPADVALAAIHILRDPRDVAVSMMHFFNMDVDVAIARMADRNHVVASQQVKAQRHLPQPLLDWSGHARSWAEATHLPVLTLRYEDMLADMPAALRQAASLCGLPSDDAAIAGAVAATRFDELRRQEQASGFKENVTAERFFRRGLAGGWRETLTAAQARRIEADHGAMMARFGYL